MADLGLIGRLSELGEDWEWSVSKYGKWHCCRIAAEGLKDEPIFFVSGKLAVKEAVEEALAQYYLFQGSGLSFPDFYKKHLEKPAKKRGRHA